jgi:pyroglutamyl-peptidase
MSPAKSPRRATAPCVLLTGFEPFGGESTNPSWQAVAQLHGRRIGGHRVIAVQLPTAFEGAGRMLRAALRAHAPRAVIAVGQAGGRAEISLERVAINLIDARIPDNTGAQPIDEPVIAGAPDAYFATLPLKAALQALRGEGIPAAISYSAGTYVCNQVFYALMHALRNRPQVPAGFVHVPYLPEQAARQPRAAASMGLETIVAGLRTIIVQTLRPQAAPGRWSAGQES